MIERLQSYGLSMVTAHQLSLISRLLVINNHGKMNIGEHTIGSMISAMSS